MGPAVLYLCVGLVADKIAKMGKVSSVPSRIVVPLDMSDASEAAIPLAREVARNRGLPVTLLSVVELPADLASFLGERSGYDEILALQESCRLYLLEMSEQFEGIEVNQVVLRGNPASQIVRYVDDLEDPLVVMSSHGHTGFRRLVVGSVLMRVVQAVDCPVLVARLGASDRAEGFSGQVRRILVPLDGSEFAEHALHAATRLIEGVNDAELHLIRIPEMVNFGGAVDMTGGYEAIELYMDATRREAEEYLERMANDLSERGMKTTWEVRDGLTSDAISEAASEWNADIIAIATHGRTGFRRFVMGSVAERVLRESPVPVLMVGPHDARDA